jgi:hypothetical protein
MPWYIQKSKFYLEKNFPSLSAQRPAGPAAAHLFFFNRPLPLSPLGLSLSTGSARPLGRADRASVAPCPIAASHSKKRKLQKPPSPSSSSHHRNTAMAAVSLASPRPRRLILPTGRPHPSSINPQSLSPLNLSLKTFKIAIYAAAITPAIQPPLPTALAPVSGPYKSHPTTPEESHTSPALLSSSPAPERTPTEHRPPPVIPLRRAAISPSPELQ